MSIKGRIKRLEKRGDTLTVEGIPWHELTDAELQEIIAWPICGIPGEQLTDDEVRRLAKGARPEAVLSHYKEYDPADP